MEQPRCRLVVLYVYPTCWNHYEHAPSQPQWLLHALGGSHARGWFGARHSPCRRVQRPPRMGPRADYCTYVLAGHRTEADNAARGSRSLTKACNKTNVKRWDLELTWNSNKERSGRRLVTQHTKSGGNDVWVFVPEACLPVLETQPPWLRQRRSQTSNAIPHILAEQHQLTKVGLLNLSGSGVLRLPHRISGTLGAEPAHGRAPETMANAKLLLRIMRYVACCTYICMGTERTDSRACRSSPIPSFWRKGAAFCCKGGQLGSRFNVPQCKLFVSCVAARR